MKKQKGRFRTILPESKKSDLSDIKLVEIYRASKDEEAFVIKGLLESQGIRCILRSDVVHSVHPFSIDGLGEVRILVAETDVTESKLLLGLREKIAYIKPAS